MMFQRIFALLIGAVLALPAYAQDAGPLELAAGMRAYTTRVFVEPKVLAELSVGDEVSFYITHFVGQDFPHTEGYVDTYVAALVAEKLNVLAVEVVGGQAPNAPMTELIIRVAGQYSDILDIVSIGYYKSKDMLEIQLIPRVDESFDPFGSDYLVVVKNTENLPIYCDECETITRVEYFKRLWNRPPTCYRSIRRGVVLTKIEIPCPND